MYYVETVLQWLAMLCIVMSVIGVMFFVANVINAIVGFVVILLKKFAYAIKK